MFDIEGAPHRDGLRARLRIGFPQARLDRAARRLSAAVYFAGILLAAGSAYAAPSIEDLQVRPNPFSPNGDGVRDATELSFTPEGDSTQVVVAVDIVRVADESAWGALLAPTSVPTGVLVTLPWSPVGLTDGDYRFDIAVVQAADSVRASVTATSDTASPTVQIGTIAPNPFDPNALPPNNQVGVEFSVASSDSTTLTSLYIRSNGALVDSVGSIPGVGIFEIKWNGDDEDSSAAPSGVYEAFVVASDGAGNLGTSLGSFTLDRDFPGLVLADTLLTSAFPFEVRGLATDNDRIVSVRYVVDPDTTSFPVDSLGAPADTVGFLARVVVPDPLVGFRKVTFRARDEVGKSFDKVLQIGYDTIVPVPISSTLLDGPGPYGERDVVRIRSIWNSPLLRVTGIFSDLDSGWLPGRETVVNEGGGSYLVTYELSRGNSRAQGDHIVRIRAASPNSTGSNLVALSDTVIVRLARSATLPEIAVDRNRINPTLRESVSIEAPLPTEAIEVEIYNLAGARVRTLEGTGEVDWDGTSEDGAACASGTYWLRIRANSEEETRRIVVWRSE